MLCEMVARDFPDLSGIVVLLNSPASDPKATTGSSWAL